MNMRVFAVTTLAAMAAFSLPVSGASVATREDVLEAIGRCATVTDDKARLACYDALTPHVKDALATPPETLSHPPTVDEQKSWFGFDLSDLFGASDAQQTTPQSFGSDNLPATKQKVEKAAEEVDHITARVIQLSYSPEGSFIVFLDNGQIWRQLQGDTDKAHFKTNGKGNVVTVSRGFFGSYDMLINDGVKIYKVTRMK
jgi:hypothetical protein